MSGTAVMRDIAAANSPVRVLVIPTDEEQEIARQTLAALVNAGLMSRPG